MFAVIGGGSLAVIGGGSLAVIDGGSLAVIGGGSLAFLYPKLGLGHKVLHTFDTDDK